MHVEAVIDDGDVDAHPDDALVPHARHVDRVVRQDAVDEVPLLGPQRVDDAEPRSHRRDVVLARTDERRDGRCLLAVLSRVEPHEGAAREPGEARLVRREDGEVALGALAGVLSLERADEAAVRGRREGGPLGVQVRARRAGERPPQEVVPLEDLVALALGKLTDRAALYSSASLSLRRRRRRREHRRGPALLACFHLVHRCAHEVVSLELADLLDVLRT